MPQECTAVVKEVNFTLCVDAIVQEVVKSSKDMHSRAMFLTQ